MVPSATGPAFSVFAQEPSLPCMGMVTPCRKGSVCFCGCGGSLGEPPSSSSSSSSSIPTFSSDLSGGSANDMLSSSGLNSSSSDSGDCLPEGSPEKLRLSIMPGKVAASPLTLAFGSASGCADDPSRSSGSLVSSRPQRVF
eukprot:1156954-Pelagomonas_calceolata.AAC.5